LNRYGHTIEWRSCWQWKINVEEPIIQGVFHTLQNRINGLWSWWSVLYLLSSVKSPWHATVIRLVFGLVS
jgi:hypothetical protein